MLASKYINVRSGSCQKANKMGLVFRVLMVYPGVSLGKTECALYLGEMGGTCAILPTGPPPGAGNSRAATFLRSSG
jgi:hypothetical protein